MKVDPDSYYLAWEWITSAQPRWGGSEDQLRHAVAYAAARTDRNPILGALLGEGAGDRPSRADDYGTVVDELVAAARMGPSAATVLRWPATATGARTTRGLPSSTTRRQPVPARTRRATATPAPAVLYDYLYDAAWARTDLLVAVRLEPDNPKYNYLLGQTTEDVEGPAAAARPYFKRAMVGQYRQSAMQRYCETFMIPQIQKEATDLFAWPGRRVPALRPTPG